MADVLTQAQIDEMLKNVAAGAVPEVSAKEEEKVKEYDFRAPKKFTKEQIKVLDGIFENYARLLSSYLTGLLRLYCRVSLVNIEEQRYSEFNNALPDYVLMGMVDMGIKNEEVSETTVIVQISNTITFTMIDRLLGGRGGDGHGLNVRVGDHGREAVGAHDDAVTVCHLEREMVRVHLWV